MKNKLPQRSSLIRIVIATKKESSDNGGKKANQKNA